MSEFSAGFNDVSFEMINIVIKPFKNNRGSLTVLIIIVKYA